MSADAVELATAYVSLVPSMQGSQGTITKELVPGAEAAGDAAGKASGKKFGGSMQSGIAALGLAAGIGAGLKGLYDIGGIFDDIGDTIRAGTGKSGEALDSLTDSAVNVGKKIPAAFEDVGSTVADVTKRMGLTGPTLEKVTSQYLEAGRVLGQEVDIAGTSAAFSAFKIEGDGVAGAMDTLFQVSQSTGVGMNELAAAVQKNAPAMQTLGFSFEETAALAGTLDKAGLNSSAMMSSMGKGMIALAKDGEEPEAAFKRVTGEIQGFVDKGDKAGALNLAAKVFGTKGASQFVGALESGKVALDDLTGGAALSGDKILDVGAETMDFAEKWQLVQNNAAAALEPLGSAVFSGLADTLTTMMPTLNDFGVWLGDNTWVLGVVAAVVGGALVVAFAAWAVSIWATTAALLANPVTWIIVGIIALIAALVMLAMNWDAVAAWVSATWGALMNWLGVVFGGLGNWLMEIWNGFTSWFMGVLSGLAGWLAGIWNGIVSFAVGVWSGLVAWISGIPGMIMAGLAWLGNLGAQFGAWVAGARDAAVNGFLGLVGWVAGLPGQILGALGNLGGLLLNAGGQIIQGFLDGLQNGFREVQNFVGGIGQWIADHKGPKAYDLALLVPAGGWIMDGLGAGIEDGLPQLEGTLTGVSDTIANGVSGGTVDLAGGGVYGVGGYDVAPVSAAGAAAAGSVTPELLREALEGARLELGVGGEKWLATVVRKGEKGLARR